MGVDRDPRLSGSHPSLPLPIEGRALVALHPRQLVGVIVRHRRTARSARGRASCRGRYHIRRSCRCRRASARLPAPPACEARPALALATATIASASGAAFVEQLLRLERRRAGDLELRIEMRGAVLQRLEFADQPAELLALLQIVDRHRPSTPSRRRPAPPRRRRGRRSSTRASIASPPPTSPTTASASTSTSSEAEPGADAANRRAATPSTSSPVRVLLDREQGQPFLGAGRDQDHVRRGALDDELLAAGQAEAVARRARRCIAIASGRCLGPSSTASAATVVAGEDAGKPARRACGVPFSASTKATAVIRKGDGREVAADLLEHDPGLDMAEPEPAIRLVDQDAGEAQLGELLPQAVAEPVLAADVAPVAQLRRDRAFLGHEARARCRGASPGRLSKRSCRRIRVGMRTSFRRSRWQAPGCAWR